MSSNSRVKHFYSSFRNSIQTELIMFVLLSLLVSNLTIGIVVILQARDSLETQIGSDVRDTGESVAGFFEDFLRERRNEISVLSQYEVLVNPNSAPEDQINFLSSIKETQGNIYTSFYIVDLDGEIVSSTDQVTGNLSNQPWFQNVVTEDGIFITDVYFLTAAQRFVITIAASLISPDTSDVNGILVANVDARYFTDILAETPIGENGELNFVNQEGVIVIAPNIQDVFRDISELDAVQAALLGQSGSTIETDSVTSETNFYSYVPNSSLDNNNWIALAILPIEEITAPTNDLIIRIAIIMIIYSSVIAIFVFIIARRIVRPIVQLTESAQLISRGNFSVEIPVSTRNEIGKLADTFRFMSNELSQIINSLELRIQERTQDLQTAADISRQITQVLNIEELLPQVVEQTKDSFNLYHVSIFLYSSETQMLLLVAGTGRAGASMKNRNKRFHISDIQGLVPLAGRERKSIIINDVAQSTQHFKDPLVPNTRSELVIPMIVGADFVGVLDLQSDQIDHFNDDNVIVLNSLAAQIAIAIYNANLYREIEEARHEAERSNQVKSSFLASMSHELRTPLNACINFTKFVVNGVMGPINDRQKDALVQVVDSSEHLLDLINDVLDMSKIESGSLRLFVQDDIDLTHILIKAAETAKALTSEKDVEINLQIDDHLPLITGDKQRLYQVMLNLVSNACKFTNDGEITISGHLSENSVLIDVKDTGPGILTEDYENVFQPFKQTNTGLRSGGGTGLGLPITKSIVEAHQGKIWIESCIGQGTTFHITLPVN